MSCSQHVRNQYTRWAVLWPGNEIQRDYLMGSPTTGMTTLFRTRDEARNSETLKAYNEMLKDRKDLRSPPFNWRARRPVKVVVTVEVV